MYVCIGTSLAPAWDWPSIRLAAKQPGPALIVSWDSLGHFLLSATFQLAAPPTTTFNHIPHHRRFQLYMDHHQALPAPSIVFRHFSTSCLATTFIFNKWIIINTLPLCTYITTGHWSQAQFHCKALCHFQPFPNFSHFTTFKHLHTVSHFPHFHSTVSHFQPLCSGKLQFLVTWQLCINHLVIVSHIATSITTLLSATVPTRSTTLQLLATAQL